MQGDRPCPRCGQVIPLGQKECPHCAKPEGRWAVERETLLLASFVTLVILFAITGVAANLYHSKQRALALEWFAHGERDLEAGHAETALEDFRTVLAYSPDTSLYRLRLAQALMAANRSDEARSHLLTLWRDEPGHGTVNLELARLAVKDNNTPDAIRYFHNAIFGVWNSNPDAQRRHTRIELSEYLLKQGETAQAQAELITLAAELPRDATLHLQVAGLLRKAGDFNRAFDEYRRALEINRRESSALAIGSGHSLGPEDPALQMGAGMASALGRRLRFSREKLRLVAPVGAAAGLAAAFNTPITAVLFVIEEVIGKWSAPTRRWKLRCAEWAITPCWPSSIGRTFQNLRASFRSRTS